MAIRKKAIGLSLLLLVVASLAGCGGRPSPASSENVKANPASDGAATEYRVVTDAFGEVKVPVKPKRVAALYLEDYMVALGVKPVVQWQHPMWGKQDYLGLNDIPAFDITGSVEALLKAEPDLIIVDGGVDAKRYEQYSKIAPTYRMPDEINQNTAKVLEKMGELLGIPDKAGQILQQYNQKAADAKAKLAKTVGEQKVAVVRLNIGDKSLAVFNAEKGFVGPTVYKDLGLKAPRLVADIKDNHALLSLEVIPQLDADHIFIFPSNGNWTSADNQEAIKVLDSPLWQSIPAVKNGNVHKLDRTYWQTWAIMANSKKIDDVLQALIK
ncbi:MAG: periplasmic binding protein [Paenibacillus sp.]|nr:periplasmic binding protein [Paenibacillus sp.]